MSKKNNYKKPVAINTPLRFIYSPEFASIMMYLYNEYFAFCFAECIGKKKDGRWHYDNENRLRTTVNYENATALYLVATKIMSGEYFDVPVKLVLPCNNKTTLTLEHKPKDGDYGYTYLTIDKDNQTITFRFQIHTAKVMLNGKVATRVIHAGLGVFAMSIEGYLLAVNADLHYSKLPTKHMEEHLVIPNEPSASKSNGNNDDNDTEW